MVGALLTLVHQVQPSQDAGSEIKLVPLEFSSALLFNLLSIAVNGYFFFTSHLTGTNVLPLMDSLIALLK